MTQPFLALITPLTQGAYPDNSLPGSQPRPDQGLPPFPSHPIVVPPGGAYPRPPGYPSHPIYYPPYPDQGLPGPQPIPTPPIYYPPYPDQGLPPFPSHPIVRPPEGGGGGNKPSNPILLPPGDNPKWALVFIPGTGWVWALVPGSVQPPTEGSPPRPDQGLPGSQPYPDQGLPGESEEA